ncbi:MAG: hypothetical protein IJT15_02685 [Rickettsiales bacterium]|nr:hypothetical protein [Rickettsiales bacterium]
MKEYYNDTSEDNHASLPVKTNNTQPEICSFSKTNVNEINVVENAEDIDGAPAPLPDCFIKENENEEAPLPQNVSALKKVLDESRKTLSKMQKNLVEKLHEDDTEILKVDDDKNNSASVYLQFDEKNMVIMQKLRML